MKFASVFHHYIAKIEKKGRTSEELFKVIEWLTGYNKLEIHKLINENVTLKLFSKSKIKS